MNKVLAALAALPLVSFAATPAHAIGVTFGEAFIPSDAVLEDFSTGVNGVGTFSPSIGYATADLGGEHVLPFSIETGNYAFVTANLSPVTLTLTGGMQYFGLLWGTVDSYNTISFYNDGVLVASYTGSQIAGLAGISDGGTAVVYANFWASAGEVFDSVVFASTSNSFEFDNVRVAATPLPAALGLFGSGIIGMGALGLRRRRRA